MSETREIPLVAVLINLVCLYLLEGLAFLIPHFTGGFQRGFFCGDETIHYKFKSSTVSDAAVIAYTIVLLIVMILLCELVVFVQGERAGPRYSFRGKTLHPYLASVLIYIGYAQAGYVAQSVLTQIAKYSIGRLRPHFFDVCKPTGYTCTTPQDYITNFVCTGNAAEVHEGRLSFFSGHSSTSFYASLFLVLYLQSRLGGHPWLFNGLPILQTLLMGTSAFVSYTRIFDNWHHWSDVLCGLIIGSIIAIYTTVIWGGMFKAPLPAHEASPITSAKIRTIKINDSAGSYSESARLDY